MTEIIEARKKLEIAQNAINGISEYIGELKDLKEAREAEIDALQVEVDNAQHKLVELEDRYGEIEQFASSLLKLKNATISLCSSLGLPIHIWPNPNSDIVDLIGIQKVIEHIQEYQTRPINKFGEVRILDI